jgi:hypothetical protein
MTDELPGGEPPGGEAPTTRRRLLPTIRLRVNWARVVIFAALFGGVAAIAYYVAIATTEGDCQAKVAAARATFRKEAEQLSAQIAAIRAEVATKTAEIARRRKANQELQSDLRKARADVEKSERALRAAEANWKAFYDRMPENCRMKAQPTPRPGTEAAPTPTPPPGQKPTPSRVPLPRLRPRRP